MLSVTDEDEKEILEGGLHCAACKVDYPINEGIPNLLPQIPPVNNKGGGMKFPLPIFMVISVGAGISESGYEIYLNRSGINSIDLPREKIHAEIGSNLRLKFLNRGAPIHITISSPNAGMFTDFFHENLYIVDEAVLPIPIRNESRKDSLISKLSPDTVG